MLKKKCPIASRILKIPPILKATQLVRSNQMNQDKLESVDNEMETNSRP